MIERKIAAQAPSAGGCKNNEHLSPPIYNHQISIAPHAQRALLPLQPQQPRSSTASAGSSVWQR